MGLLRNEILFLFIRLAFFEFCKGAVYKVGDAATWTTIGNVDYNKWASPNTVQVGDTLLSEYDPQYHNMLQVSRSDFQECDSTAPTTTYTTGNDSIAIRSPGHYYFICGFNVGHCQGGQKIDIGVPKSLGLASRPIMSPHVSDVPMASPVGPLAPSPLPNSRESHLRFNIGLLLIFIWVLF